MAVQENRACLGVGGELPSRLDRRRRPCVDPRGGKLPTEEAVRSNFIDQVPADLTGTASDWQTVLAGRWTRDDGILRGEGRALILAARHSLRSLRHHNKRIVLLAANMSVVLAAS